MDAGEERASEQGGENGLLLVGTKHCANQSMMRGLKLSGREEGVCARMSQRKRIISREGSL